MKPLRIPALAAAAAASLTACGGSGQPAAPAIAPTEVTAVQTPPPDYPLELACAGLGGVSTLKVVISGEGTPSEVGVARSSGQPELDQAALAVVRTWRFKPATRNGQPITQSIQVPVNFQPPAERPNQCFALDEQKRKE